MAQPEVHMVLSLDVISGKLQKKHLTQLARVCQASRVDDNINVLGDRLRTHKTAVDKHWTPQGQRSDLNSEEPFEVVQ